MTFPRPQPVLAFESEKFALSEISLKQGHDSILGSARVFIAPGVEISATITPDGRVTVSQKVHDDQLLTEIKQAMRATTLIAVVNAFSATASREDRMAKSAAEATARYYAKLQSEAERMAAHQVPPGVVRH